MLFTIAIYYCDMNNPLEKIIDSFKTKHIAQLLYKQDRLKMCDLKYISALYYYNHFYLLFILFPYIASILNF
jgi:hypothetical protein